MKIVVSITNAEAQQLIGKQDTPDLHYVETLDYPDRSKNIVVEDRMHHFYLFSPGELAAGQHVVLHPVEREEHCTYTYRRLP